MAVFGFLILVNMFEDAKKEITQKDEKGINPFFLSRRVSVTNSAEI